MDEVAELTLSADREGIAAGQKGRLYLLAEVRALGRAVEGARPPMSVAFVVDASGSMHGVPIDQALSSVGSMLDLLADGDRVGLAAFSDDATEVVPMSAVGPDTARVVRARCARVAANGNTNVEAGLLLAKQMLGARAPHARHVVLMLSDGQPNRGATSADDLRALAAELRKEATVSTLGYGPQHDDVVLAAVADGGAGSYRFVPDPATALVDFAHALGAQGDVVADGVELVLAPKDGVEIAGVLGKKGVRASSKGLVVPLPDLFEGARQLVAIEIEVDARREPGEQALVTATLRHRVAGKADVRAIVRDATIAAGAAPALIPRVHHGVLVVRADEVRAQARALADRGSFEGAAAHVRAFLAEIAAAPGYTPNDGSALAETYEQLLDEAMAFERRPAAEQYNQWKKGQQGQSMAAGHSVSVARSIGAYSRGTLSAAAGAFPDAWLEVVRGPEVGKRHPLGAYNVLGRTATADVVIHSANVSRAHARVFAQLGRFWVADLGSTNTTRLNGVALTAHHAPLTPGDVLLVGDVELVYREARDD